MKTNIVLASASPRRRELLEQIGVQFTTHAADIDETPLPNELPIVYVARMAKAKAHKVCEQITVSSVFVETEERFLILASDTSVVLGDEIFGKPQSKSDFFRMMTCLSGNTHEVMTSVHAIELGQSLVKSEHAILETTKVRFKPISKSEMESYWSTGEPEDKAGGYGIQGRGALFVEAIQGSYSSVVGLPLKETADLLVSYNVDVWSS